MKCSYNAEDDMRVFLKTQIILTFKTQRDFALACGKSDDWISKIVLGIKSPTKEERELICAKLRVEDGDYLFINQ